MKLFLGYETAYSFWMSVNNFEMDYLQETQSYPSIQAAHTPTDVKSTAMGTRFQDSLLDVCVPVDAHPRKSKDVVFHRADALAPRAFLKYQKDIYIASPETNFLQMAKTLSFEELVIYGNELCGSYVRNPFSPDGIDDRKPLLKLSNLNRALQGCGNKTGVKKALQAAQYITPNCASPMESFVALQLALPYKYGGAHELPFICNYEIKIPPSLKYLSDKEFFRADLCWPDKKVAIEYDSDFHHRGTENITRDTTRRNTLLALGYKVIGVTRAQAMDILKMGRVIDELNRALGRRDRTIIDDYPIRRHDLYEKLKESLTNNLEK